ncbi:sugar kinase [Novosphingobium sp. KACC 22771]|uniref:sugar kinase n=1 Tax=Novosphingobium sp. KACC 22771 TaxID=3025670 RepID=UPI0023673472|nr:sugar kinase [Novosphingobium sp. KACC 22771]WDF74689.1 sugar kinase [Novosphingobium sp. KACC 22771]
MSGPVVCFGEVMLRFATPAGRVIADAQSLDLTIGGAEANVGVALVAMGHGARFVSKVPANALGDKARAALAGVGVDVAHFVRGEGRMGLYFLEVGGSLRPSAITYDRAGSAFATARPDEFDFAAALDGASLFHISGITAALGPAGVELARSGIKAAKAAGVPVSFDCNFREKLWGAWDSNPREILLELLAEATIMFGNHRDMTLLLQKPFSGDGAERRREAVEAAFATFPNLQVMASTARHPITQTHHRLSARVDLREDRHQTAEIEITDIVDRVGSGDAFAAGVLTGWLEGGDAKKMAQLGLAMNALKHSLHGDWLRLPRAEIDGFTGNSGDVRR